MENTEFWELSKSFELVAQYYKDKHHDLWNGEEQHSLSDDEFNLKDNQLQAILQQLEMEEDQIKGGMSQ